MQYRSLKSLVIDIVDNRGKTCPTVDAGIPLIATNCIKNNELHPKFERVRYVSRDTYENWFRGHPKPGDFLFVTKGNPGQICLVPDPVEFCIAQDMVALRANCEEVYPPYLFAVLRAKATLAKITNMHVGTMIPHFKKGDFDKLLLPLPNLSTQRYVGDFYMRLSQKIEHNRQMNQTLEEIAQAIFRDWFVNFGPVRRKLSGITDPKKIMGGLVEDPAKAKELATLFPKSLGDDGLPAGWEMKPVIEQANWINGAAYKNMHFGNSSEALPVIKITELKAGVTTKTKYTNTELGEKFKIGNGELLFSWSGNPDTSIDTFIWTGGEAWLNQHIFAVRDNGTRTRVFLHTMLRFLKPKFTAIARDKQTTGLGHVTKADLKRMQICTASSLVLEAFENIVKPIHTRFVANMLENQTLAETRDYLLPKLMSGEIRVGDVAVETETKPSNVVPIGGDFFDSQSLSANDNQERDSVMVAGVIQGLQKYDGVVGNVKYQKGCYFVYRLMELPIRDFEKQAAGPYNTKIKEGGYRDALTNRYIRRTRKNGYSGNIPASRISQIDQLILHYGLGEALAWVKTHLRGKNRDELELWATVDYAMVALQNRKITPTADSVRAYINGEPEWAEKLKRAAFSSSKIKQAIIDLNKLFARTVTIL